MRFTIKLKLFLTFGFMIAVLVGTAGYGIMSLGGLNTTLGDVLNDRPALKQAEIAFLIGRDLAEGIERAVGRLLQRLKGDEAHRIGLSDFFQRPADPGVARQALAAIGRPLEGRDRDRHR